MIGYNKFDKRRAGHNLMADETAQTYFERFQPDYTVGLSPEQVELRHRQGLFNAESDLKTKTDKQIILQNIVTPFNILNAVLALLIILVGSYKNLLFMGVIVCNTCIGAFQEIRAKRTIDRLALIAAPKAKVVRGGVISSIGVHELVLDDIFLLEAGSQICTDCIVAEGECEVNESLLTGESDPVPKKPGDLLLSGSFVASGSCRAKVEHIGADNYAEKISNGAKYMKKPNSEIMTWINRIIRLIGVLIIPIGLMLFYKQIHAPGETFSRSVVTTVAALIGMIPEGLVLLTSVVLAVSVIRLSRHKTLVQELYCIETLARVDMLCLDKTGTITEGTLQFERMVPFGKITPEQVRTALGALTCSLRDNNPTMDALREKFHTSPGWACTESVPFSSANKWSGATFDKIGTFVLGAAEIVMGPRFSEIREAAEQYSRTGQRVLLLAFSPNGFSGKKLPEHPVPLALLLLSDKIRPEAPETLRYFAEQGVCLKVISGDSPITVANIAKKAGLPGAEKQIDARTLKTPEALKQAAEEYTVFGRVTPQQKLELVQALKKNGHTVAMTGDGVNDVLALKESDCSIAMASGSEAARTVSQLVLLDSDFSSLPLVVHEGRRSINNLQRSASLFLVKAFFSAIIAVYFIFSTHSYPFQPIQFTLINTFTIGIPSFILALEPNKERMKGKFIVNIVKKSLPGMLTMVLNIVLLMPICSFMRFSPEQISTIAVILTGFTGLINLLRVCLPFNLLRAALFYSMAGGFVASMVCFSEFFSLIPLTLPMLMVILPMLAFAVCMMGVVLHMVERVLMRKIGD
mgnify:CR=1 FL=1